MPRCVFFLILLGFLPLKAQFFGAEGWVSGQNAILAQILAQESTANSVVASDIIPRAIQSINIAQDTLRGIEDVKRLYKMVSRFTPEQLADDAQKSFCAAFPDTCSTIADGIGDFVEDAETVTHGTERFWSYTDAWSGKNASGFEKFARGMRDAYVSPQLAPLMSKFYGRDKEGAGDVAQTVINAALAASGLDKTMLSDNLQARAIGTEMEKFLAEADRSGNILARGQSLQSAYLIQQVRDLGALKHIAESAFLDETLKKTEADIKAAAAQEAYRKENERQVKNHELENFLKMPKAPSQP